MKAAKGAQRPAPARDGDDRRRRSRQPARSAAHRAKEAPPRRGRPAREQRPQRSAPQTNPISRPTGRPTPPKNASQAKARAKARKAKAPKVTRPPLRERLLTRLASIDLNPRSLAAKVPFVVLVIGSLGLGLGITLWLSTAAAERSYQLGNAREANHTLSQQKEALERDVLEAQAAPALAEAARNIGMIPSRDTAHLVQDPAGNWIVVGTPKPAEGAPPPPLNTPLPDEAGDRHRRRGRHPRHLAPQTRVSSPSACRQAPGSGHAAGRGARSRGSPRRARTAARAGTGRTGRAAASRPARPHPQPSHLTPGRLTSPRRRHPLCRGRRSAPSSSPRSPHPSPAPPHEPRR